MAKRKKKSQKKQRNNTLAKALIALGIILLLLGLATHTKIYYRYLITQQEKPTSNTSSNIPREILIPAAKINIGVDQGGIVSGNWVLSSTNALYLPTSGKLGEGYNTIIYAHNTSNLFGNLKNAQTGDLIMLKDKSGQLYTYRIVSEEDVDPSALDKLYSTQKNIITLFTCDGWADTSRLLVKAKLVKN